MTGTPKSPPSKLSLTCTLLPEKPAWLLGLKSVIVLYHVRIGVFLQHLLSPCSKYKKQKGLYIFPSLGCWARKKMDYFVWVCPFWQVVLRTKFAFTFIRPISILMPKIAVFTISQLQEAELLYYKVAVSLSGKNRLSALNISGWEAGKQEIEGVLP